MNNNNKEIIVIGGGLTGLSAGYILTKAGFKVTVFENDSTVGGLSKTIIHNGFRFDLGGHRFFTKDKRIDNFVKDLMGDELISVPRKSRIYLRGKYFDYPLKPMNAFFGLGALTTAKIILDYGVERCKGLVRKPATISLEDWVVSNFGRTMFDIYFKVYSEKVWGLDCRKISVDWVAQRIRGLSLSKAIKNAFFRLNGKDIPSLVDEFVYPQLGIGRISDRLKEEIEKSNSVSTDTIAYRISHSGSRIENIEIKHLSPPHPPFLKGERGALSIVAGEEFISSIPLTKLVKMLNPPPPENILRAAENLRFRDLVIVAVMINRKRVTDQTWIYIPEPQIPFGRIHEPTNWSEKMAPDGNTILVTEYFCFRNDRIWNKNDEELAGITVRGLEELGFVKKHEVTDSVVLRVPKAYPLFEIGYSELCKVIYDYLDTFKNMHIAGRSGMFRYYNMDHAIESGINTAEKIIGMETNKEMMTLISGNK